MSTARVENGLVDVVDEEGRVTGTATRRAVRDANLRHRTVFIAVLSCAGELLVHRRADWKDLWPGAWDIAFGGVVEAGEDWEAAAARELAEETGLGVELAYLGEATYEDDDVREIARVYLARHEGDITCPDGEVVDVRWVPLDGLVAWLDDTQVCPDSVAIVLPRLDAP
jgi:8-oxo-dGTP pyrophosphatase MutT (NUDIX family)